MTLYEPLAKPLISRQMSDRLVEEQSLLLQDVKTACYAGSSDRNPEASQSLSRNKVESGL
jgi:hypothetical protein